MRLLRLLPCSDCVLIYSAALRGVSRVVISRGEKQCAIFGCDRAVCLVGIRADAVLRAVVGVRARIGVRVAAVRVSFVRIDGHQELP